MLFAKAAVAQGASTLKFSFHLAILMGLSFGLGGAAASALADEKSQTELLKPLQGSWVSSGEGLDATWSFEGEKAKATVNGVEYTCKVKIDTEAKPHKTIDFEITDGPDEAKGKMSKCIYKLDGEKLTLCVSMPGKDRPKEFEQAEGEAYLFDLKKEKKKD